MRIHHVTPHFHPEHGGLEESVFRFASWQASRGDRVVVHTSALTTTGHILPTEGSVQGVRIRRYSPAVRRGYYRTLFRPQIDDADVVHMHGYAVRTNDYVARHVRGTPLVFSLHHGVRMPHPTPAMRILRRGYDMVIGIRTLRRVDRILVASDGDIPWLRHHDIPETKVRVLPTPLSDNAFEPAKDVPGRARVGGPYFLYLGRLHVEKGVDDLLEAFAQLPRDARIVYAGPDGGRLAALQARAQQLGVAERVSFLGPVTEVEKQALLSACTCLVLPSLFEAQGLAILEAWAHGRPVVASQVGALAEVVRSGETGILVRHGDIPALADALQRLWSEPDAADAMGRLGRVEAEAFRAERILPELDRIYRELVRADGRGT